LPLPGTERFGGFWPRVGVGAGCRLPQAGLDTLGPPTCASPEGTCKRHHPEQRRAGLVPSPQSCNELPRSLQLQSRQLGKPPPTSLLLGSTSSAPAGTVSPLPANGEDKLQPEGPRQPGEMAPRGRRRREPPAEARGGHGAGAGGSCSPAGLGPAALLALGDGPQAQPRSGQRRAGTAVGLRVRLAVPRLGRGFGSFTPFCARKTGASFCWCCCHQQDRTYRMRVVGHWHGLPRAAVDALRLDRV